VSRLTCAAIVVGTGLTLAGHAAPQAQGQMPPVSNGRLEPRQATSIDSAIAAVSAASEPVWIGWAVPLAEHRESLCTQWAPDLTSAPLTRIEPDTPMAAPAPSPPPVRLEGGANLVVLLRLVAGRVERLRTLDDECPIDAGGRTVQWLSGISASESVRYLATLIRAGSPMAASEQRVALAVVPAIALHRDPAADAPLDRLLAADDSSDAMVRQATLWMGSARGAHGFETLTGALGRATDPRRRRMLVTALGQSRQPKTADALYTLARTDPDAAVRAEAVHWYARQASAGVLGNVMGIIMGDTEDVVRRRAVSSLGLIAADNGVPALIQLARTGPSPVIRKEAVSTLARTTDARARAFLEELVAR
jgi:hypothetical protein